MVKRKKLYFGVFIHFFLGLFFLHSQELIIEIPFGSGAKELLAFESEGEFWHPRFFGIDSSRTLYIPDIYNGRLVTVSLDSKQFNSITAVPGMSPRMRSYAVLENGDQITFDDSVLFCLDRRGEVLWHYRFSPGFVPYTVVATESFVFVVPAAANTKSLLFDRYSGTAIGSYGKKEDGQDVSYVQTDFGTSVSLFYHFEDFSSKALFAAEPARNELFWRVNEKEQHFLMKTDRNFNIKKTYNFTANDAKQIIGPSIAITANGIYYSLLSRESLKIMFLTF